MRAIAEALSEIFAGLERAHGEYRITGRAPGGKVLGKGATVRTPPTLDLWVAHLEGKQGLGIIPIREDNTCVWGCLDIDDHQIDHAALVRRIRELKLPLIVARSKSGGAHCFLFLSEPLPAEVVREHLQSWAAWLGYGGCEVFPKQTRLAGPEDVGNWLNMPYFDAERTLRYALHPETGEALSVEAFVDVARAARVSGDDLAAIELPEPEEADLPGAPPCLRLLVAQGIQQGMRNESLFNLGVYYRKAHPEDWEERLEEANHKLCNPPLRSREMQQLIKSLQRKDYFYKCNEAPLKALCNKSMCRRCEHGIGGDAEVEITSLTRIDTRPPIWIAEVDGERIKLTTDELANPARFAKKCMEVLGKWPATPKQAEWRRLINRLMESMEIVEVPEESGPEGLFWQLLWSFLEAAGSQAKRKEDLLLHHKVWREDGMIWFRSIGLMEWLKTHRFNELSQREIWALLRQHDAIVHRQMNIRGRCVQVWGVPEDFGGAA